VSVITGRAKDTRKQLDLPVAGNLVDRVGEIRTGQSMTAAQKIGIGEPQQGALALSFPVQGIQLAGITRL